MSTKRELLAQDRSIEQIREFLGADHVIYQTVDDLLDAARASNPSIEGFCSACFDGRYPTQDITPEMFASIEQSRIAHHGADG